VEEIKLFWDENGKDFIVVQRVRHFILDHSTEKLAAGKIDGFTPWTHHETHCFRPGGSTDFGSPS